MTTTKLGRPKRDPRRPTLLEEMLAVLIAANSSRIKAKRPATVRLTVYALAQAVTERGRYRTSSGRPVSPGNVARLAERHAGHVLTYGKGGKRTNVGLGPRGWL